MITTLSKQILVTSLNKAIDYAKINGNFNLKILHLYSLIIHYIEFTEGNEDYNAENRKLKELLSNFKYKYPDIICNYKLRVPNINIKTRDGNTAPTVSDNIIDLNGKFIRPFRIEDFTKDYFDAEYDSWHKIMIVLDSLTAVNKLYYMDTANETVNPYPIPVTNNMEIPYALISNLIFIEPMDTQTGDPTNTNEVNYNVRFRISDNYLPNSLYSAVHTVTIINSKYVENNPPTIGDIAVTADNRAETILTLDMFTTQMKPPYNDPEGDLIDAIRIDSISSANEGIFYYDNNPIEVGDIITREDISSGLFKHIGPNIDSLSGDSMEFSARDEGSQKWVQ